MAAGNVIPLDRSGLLDQPLFKIFQQKAAKGAWCHIFAEGRIWQNWRFPNTNDTKLGPFKYGLGKIIAHSYPDVPIVLPMYHTGMDLVMPERQLKMKNGKHKRSSPKSPWPSTGHEVRMYVGKPMDFTAKVRAFSEQHPGQLEQWAQPLSFEKIQLYEDITTEVRQQVLLLEAEAYNRRQEQATLLEK